VEDAALFCHLLGAFSLVSGAVVAGVAFEAARRRESPVEIAALLGLARTGAALAGVGMLVVPVFGLWLADLGDWGSAGWIKAAFVLFVAAAVLGGIGGRTPREARMLASRLAGAGEPQSPELRALLDDRRAQLMNYASGALILAVLVLMVWKPGAA
jgi:uncharacterized membrane protein